MNQEIINNQTNPIDDQINPINRNMEVRLASESRKLKFTDQTMEQTKKYRIKSEKHTLASSNNEVTIPSNYVNEKGIKSLQERLIKLPQTNKLTNGFGLNNTGVTNNITQGIIDSSAIVTYSKGDVSLPVAPKPTLDVQQDLENAARNVDAFLNRTSVPTPDVAAPTMPKAEVPPITAFEAPTLETGTITKGVERPVMPAPDIPVVPRFDAVITPAREERSTTLGLKENDGPIQNVGVATNNVETFSQVSPAKIIVSSPSNVTGWRGKLEEFNREKEEIAKQVAAEKARQEEQQREQARINEKKAKLHAEKARLEQALIEQEARKVEQGGKELDTLSSSNDTLGQIIDEEKAYLIQATAEVKEIKALLNTKDLDQMIEGDPQLPYIVSPNFNNPVNTGGRSLGTNEKAA